MAATLTQERFTGPEWTFERKLDGIRLLAFKDARGVRLMSRTRHPQDLPRIAEAVARLPAREVILDGEVEWDGTTYHVFDVAWLDADLTVLRTAYLPRHRLSRPVARAHGVLEAEAGSFARWGLVVGDRLELKD